MTLKELFATAILKNNFPWHFPGHINEYLDIRENIVVVINTHKGIDYTETTYTQYEFDNNGKLKVK